MGMGVAIWLDSFGRRVFAVTDSGGCLERLKTLRTRVGGYDCNRQRTDANKKMEAAVSRVKISKKTSTIDILCSVQHATLAREESTGATSYS